MKKLTALILSLALLLSVTAAALAQPSGFEDVSEDAWYAGAVSYVKDKGLFQGTSDTTFSPNVPMTRGMFVTVLGRLTGINPANYLRYRYHDVLVGSYYAPYVEWASSYQVVNGTGSGMFSPDEKISREQMATILYRYATATGNNTQYDNETYKTFSDLNKISAYAETAMLWATSKKILQGSNGKLDPKGDATRAQVAQVFLNCKSLFRSTTMRVTATNPEARYTRTTDGKAASGNLIDLFATSFAFANNKKVTAQSRLAAEDQVKLIQLLDGKTGKAMWNEIALKGYTGDPVGTTRDAFFTLAGEKVMLRCSSLEEVAQSVIARLAERPDVQYYCVTLADGTSDIEGVLEDYRYMLYMINDPDALDGGSQYVSSIKKKLAERIPATFVWSSTAAEAGTPVEYTYLPGSQEISDSALADRVADFFSFVLMEAYGSDGAGHIYYLVAEPAGAGVRDRISVYVE